MEKIVKSNQEWRQILSDEQYRILREHGTERAGTSPLDKEYGKGLYKCAGCGIPVFNSEAKFNSGTGWPSYFAPINEEVISQHEDRCLFSVRTEIRCARCDGHLGHVFPDGPKPTGLRYCINGVALDFEPEDNH